MDKILLVSAALLLASATAAYADGTQVYKWTDAQGVVHYSDKAPKEIAPDLATLQMDFPAPDPAKLAAAQAALQAEKTALQQDAALQATLEQQRLELAREQAELAAAQQPAQDEPATVVEPIYVQSASVPRVYRRNLYVPHPSFNKMAMQTHTNPPSRPPIPVLQKP